MESKRKCNAHADLKNVIHVTRFLLKINKLKLCTYMTLLILFISLKISLPYYIDAIFTFECLIEGHWIFIFY